MAGLVPARRRPHPGAGGLVERLPDGTWALTGAGIERLREDRELGTQ